MMHCEDFYTKTPSCLTILLFTEMVWSCVNKLKKILGVGDGQVHSVANTEVNQFLQTLKDITNDLHQEMPGLAVIIVRKRINTRFFSKANPAENVPPGTVVDEEIIDSPSTYFQMGE